MAEIQIAQIGNSFQTIGLITPGNSSDCNKENLITFLNANSETIYQNLYLYGGILFRNFGLNNQEDFLQITSILTKDKRFSYVDGNSPRTNLGNNVFTSTEYPMEYDITLHNELSYSAQYPSFISFFCLIPPNSGGETPLLDGRKFLSELSKDIVEKFKKHGVRYTRYLSGKKGLGKTWMETFETQNKDHVELYCKKNAIDFIWEGEDLSLSQNGVGLLKHPITSEWVWFNQANQFHPSSLPVDIYKMLKLIHKDHSEKYPQYATFGNGDLIPEEHLNDITKKSFQHALSFKWEKGDLLILDNILMAHGRHSYSGERKILVTMC